MKVIRNILFLLVLLMPGIFYGITEKGLETGKIVSRVVTLADSTQSYALYLPSNYSREKNWPLLFTFDPGARSGIPLTLFKKVAEKYGYIVVCSNNLKNGPWQFILKAMKAVWSDVLNRFSIDFDRIYATGFSGGARAAAAFPHITGARAAGIIACGAGLPPAVKANQVKPAFYHGVVGVEDYNYKEMIRLNRELEAAGVDHFIEVFNGDHGWPPENICHEAIEGMELRAMKKGLRPKDRDLIETVFRRSLEKVRNLEAILNPYYARDYCLALEALFRDLIETGPIRDKITQLEASRELNKFQKEEDKRNRTELEFIRRFLAVFTGLKNNEQKRADLKKVSNELDLNNLVREASRTKNPYQGAMAKRLLDELVSKGNQEGNHYLKKRDFIRARIFFGIAARANATGIRAYYNLACVYALQNDKKSAIRYLNITIENARKKGYRDFSFLMKEKNLDSLRKEKEFIEMIGKLGLKVK